MLGVQTEKAQGIKSNSLSLYFDSTDGSHSVMARARNAKTVSNLYEVQAGDIHPSGLD